MPKLPYQIFPGIFSSIDSYNKKVVHGWFDRHQSSPHWLRELGPVKGYQNPPHFTKFFVVDDETCVRLRGTPDGILVREDDSFLIVDYKTAKFTANQDALLPTYETQLNAYAYIGERTGFTPVSGLVLVYMEPVTDDVAAGNDGSHTDEGFLMGFSAHILPVEIKPDLVPPLLRKVREISDLPRPPAGLAGCENCGRVDSLVDATIS